MRSSRALTVAAVLAFAAGCGPVSPPASGGRQVQLADPCRLLTQSEIVNVVGIDFGAAEPVPAEYECNWRSAAPRQDSDQPTVVTVSVYEFRPDGMTALENPTPAGGIGDEADFCGTCIGDRTLYVRKGSAYFSVDEYPCYPIGGTCNIAMQDEKALALKVLPRLSAMKPSR